jgi:hypothetical protein
MLKHWPWAFVILGIIGTVVLVWYYRPVDVVVTEKES